MSLRKLPLGTRITKCKRNGLWLFGIEIRKGEWIVYQNRSFQKGLKGFLKLKGVNNG